MTEERPQAETRTCAGQELTVCCGGMALLGCVNPEGCFTTQPDRDDGGIVVPTTIEVDGAEGRQTVRWSDYAPGDHGNPLVVGTVIAPKTPFNQRRLP